MAEDSYYEESFQPNLMEPAGSELREVPPYIKRWWRADREHSRKWRNEAKEDFDFVAGHGQWTEADRQKLLDENRPVITFNRTEVIIDAVSGNEINNRNEVKYYPREVGDALPSEIYSEAARWFDDESEAADEESEAFRSTIICGMGWTETRIDFDNDPDGEPLTDEIDALEMYWDAGCRKTNLIGARRLWRIRKMSIEEAEEMFPSVPRYELNASSWLDYMDEIEDDPHVTDPARFYEGGELNEDESFFARNVCIIQMQYYEMTDYYRVADPFTQRIVDMEVDKFEELQQKLISFGIQLKAVKMRKKRYKQMFIGRRILEEGDAPCPDHYSWNCITGKKDRSRGTWYGMVRAMKDPQIWANKWLAQMLHILNSNAKGGLLIEEDALPGEEDIRSFEDNWSRPNSVSTVASGAIAGGKIKEKTMAQFPTGFQVLTEFAIRAIREVSGVSLELLGLRELNQPGVLEHQRKQAGMAILASLFNNLRRYRKQRGRVLLYFIDNFLADGQRLIRIVGDEKAQYVPLMKQTAAKYDIIVDESPHSINQKEVVWNSLVQILPGIKDIVPPNVMLTLLKYSPIPASVVEEVRRVISAPNPEEEQKQQIILQKALIELAKDKEAVQKLRADIEKVNSETEENYAQIDKILSEIKTAGEQGERTRAETKKIGTEALKTVFDALVPNESSTGASR